MNESKPNSGWNESKPSFPITMNVGEAIAYASKDKCFWTGEVHTALETLAAEVERLRGELKVREAELVQVDKWLAERSDAYGKTCSMVDQLQTELAAAKDQFVNDCIKHINRVGLLNDCEFESGMIADSIKEYFRDRNEK